MRSWHEEPQKGRPLAAQAPPMATAYHKHANQWLMREPSSLPRRPCLCILPSSKYQRHIIAHQHGVSHIRHTEIMEKRVKPLWIFLLSLCPLAILREQFVSWLQTEIIPRQENTIEITSQKTLADEYSMILSKNDYSSYTIYHYKHDW